MHLDRLKDAVYLPINYNQEMHLEAKSYSLLAMEIALNVKWHDTAISRCLDLTDALN